MAKRTRRPLYDVMSLFPKKFSRGYPTLKARPQEEFNFRESISLPDPTTGHVVERCYYPFFTRIACKTSLPIT